MAATQPRIGIDHPTVVPAAPPPEGEQSPADGEPSVAEVDQSTTERRGRDA
jgi:hypothetical protein